MADEVTIRVNEHGPYRVKGPITLLDPDGNEYDLGGRRSIFLCRCGASTRKPFCDGTHSELGFQAAERAVREQEGRSA